MIGIDLSDNSIKLVEVKPGSPPFLHTLHWSLLEPGIIQSGFVKDIPALRAAITAALENCVPAHPSTHEAVVSVPERHTFLQIVMVPVMSDAEITEAVRWAAQPNLPLNINEVYLDWQPVPDLDEQDNKRPVLVGAVPKQVIDPIIDVFRDVPLTLAAIETSSQALVRGTIAASARETEDVVIIDLGAALTNIIFYSRGSVRLSTSLARSGTALTAALVRELHLPPQEAEAKKIALGLSPPGSAANQPISDVLQRETRRLLEDVRRMISERVASDPFLNEPRLLIAAGGTSNLSNLESIVAEVFPKTPFQVSRPWANVELTPHVQALKLSPADATHFVLATGLALRPPAHGKKVAERAINLLPLKFRNQLISSRASGRLDQALSFGTVGALCLTVIALISWLALLVATRVTPVTVASELEKEVQRHQAIAAAFEHRNTVIKNIATIPEQTITWTNYVPKIIHALPNGIILRELRGVQTEKQLILSGRAASREALQTAEDALQAVSGVDSVFSPPENFLRQTDNDFRLELTLNQQNQP